MKAISRIGPIAALFLGIGVAMYGFFSTIIRQNEASTPTTSLILTAVGIFLVLAGLFALVRRL